MDLREPAKLFWQSKYQSFDINFIRAMASNMSCNFMKVVASAIVDKYIGESARVIRDMFGYAKENSPCIIFMDEIDAIGGRRFNEGTSADREIQRTLMEVKTQKHTHNLDSF